ncbi:MAG: hypothetical protein V2A78_05915 [bacterium]
MFPQSFSTDRRYGRLSLKAIGLFPLMWANADDQGRLCGDPEEIKYAVCPNIDHITKRDIPDLLKELQYNKLILCYDTPKSAAIQMLDWWDANHKMQWAWPSDYQPPEGWQDHLRYKKDAKTVLALNWPVSGEAINSAQVSVNSFSGEYSGEEKEGTQVSGNYSSGERSGETTETSPLTTPSPIKQNKTKRGNRRGRGNSPEDSAERSGEEPSPSPAGLSLQERSVYDSLLEGFRMRFGKPLPPDYKKIKPREPDFRERAQLRDLAKEISAAGGCEFPMVKQAFDEASGQHKQHISYVRAVLLDWLGVERVHSSNIVKNF